jgi:hypothetical protein
MSGRCTGGIGTGITIEDRKRRTKLARHGVELTMADGPGVIGGKLREILRLFLSARDGSRSFIVASNIINSYTRPRVSGSLA